MTKEIETWNNTSLEEGNPQLLECSSVFEKRNNPLSVKKDYALILSIKSYQTIRNVKIQKQEV